MCFFYACVETVRLSTLTLKLTRVDDPFFLVVCSKQAHFFWGRAYLIDV